MPAWPEPAELPLAAPETLVEFPSQPRATLPTAWYHEPAQYQRELEAIWYREWLCAGHQSEWPEPGAFRVFTVGDQQLLIIRDREGHLGAFHNTCRHRGARLCETAEGRLPGGRITCGYHGWSYAADGRLLTAPRMDEVPGFEKSGYGLYRAGLTERAGFVFVNLDAAADADSAGPALAGAEALAGWPMDELALVHREQHQLACNWKVFWENYLECYHCPGVHPRLCALVPLYREAVTRTSMLAPAHPDFARPLVNNLRPGAVTWSEDGSTPLPEFSGLGETQRAAGMTFADFPPGAFVVAHVDYIRSVQIMALAPTRTVLTVSWFLHRDLAAQGGFDLERLTGFARQVVREDARVCELNQAGLASRAHAQGVLSPAEIDVAAFHDWLRLRLEKSGAAATASG